MVKPPDHTKKIDWTVNEKGCWICTSHSKGGRNTYPHMTRDYKVIQLSRHMYELYKGKIPSGLILRHTCDNVKCINPEHLILGTHKDNMADMTVRGRAAKWELNGAAKLTMEKVEQIRKSYASGKVSQRQLAQEFSIHQRQIFNIIHNLTWKF